MRSFKVSGTTAAQWSYYLARLKCGLVKGKHIDAVFGSKTALEWMARSGAADQSLKSRRRGYGKTNAKLSLCIYARLTQLEECMVYTHDVGGSSPSLRTIVERLI